MRRRDFLGTFARSTLSPCRVAAIAALMSLLVLALPAAAADEESGWLGVGIETAEEEVAGNREANRGALIVSIVADGPADEAGLRAGDVITSANRSPITSAKDLTTVVQELRPGASLRVRFLRRGDEHSSAISLGSPPTRNTELRFKKPWTGLSTLEVPLQLRLFWGGSTDAGLMVATIVPGGPADLAGFWPGDLILAVDGKPVVDERSLERTLQRGGVGNAVEVEVSRQGTYFKVDLELAERP